MYLLDQHRQATVFGYREEYIFSDTAIKYVSENTNKSSVEDDKTHLKQLFPFIGTLKLTQIHDGTLEPFINHRLKEGKKPKTINNALSIVRTILNRAARKWRDENGNTWIETAPIISLLDVDENKALPYPLSWEEQKALLQTLPPHLARMALFKVNTGTREQEVCRLRWDWEVQIPELDTTVFIIPAWANQTGVDSKRKRSKRQVKNGEDRLVVLNRVARSVIDDCRNEHSEFVFTYQRSKDAERKPLGAMNNTAWRKAWKKANLPSDGFFLKGVHNLKHTFGRRLRAAGVPLETRKVLLGHTNGDITTHYSSAEINELIEAVEKVCGKSGGTPALTLLKLKTGS